MSRFINIDEFYREHRSTLLEEDRYRLCKSIPRDIGAYVVKFADFYKSRNEETAVFNISEEIITYDILNLDNWSDVVTTAKRIMKEFGFLREESVNEYVFTENFGDFIDHEVNFPEFLLEKLKRIYSLKDMTMLYNSIICTLREGYIYGKILVFPDSCRKFLRAVTNIEDRSNFRRRVFEIYGFAGRYRDHNRDDYTPNANYRIVTVLRLLGFIEPIHSDFDEVSAFELTEIAYKYLDLLNTNLGVVSEEDFENLIDKDNDFQIKLQEFAEKYGVSGTIQITQNVRLPQVQNAFRDRLISNYGKKCMLCDITNHEMLIASHIKRASDVNIFGKADYNNGLLFCANHDKLFDKYLVSFSCVDGKIMISSFLTEIERAICGLITEYCLPEYLLTDERMEYLMDHNLEFLRKESERKK